MDWRGLGEASALVLAGASSVYARHQARHARTSAVVADTARERLAEWESIIGALERRADRCEDSERRLRDELSAALTAIVSLRKIVEHEWPAEAVLAAAAGLLRTRAHDGALAAPDEPDSGPQGHGGGETPGQV